MKLFPRLGPEQQRGANPAAHAWVSASAGAGKTQLLTARILRLLLAGAHPERLLALTFTKAAAAEMQERVLGRLMAWVGADDAFIAADLEALALEPTPELVARARSLFAAALDARGGLKVQTIHAFAAALLQAFPLEAGTPPDFETLDDRGAEELEETVLERALARATPALLTDIGELAVRHSEGKFGEKMGAFRGCDDDLLELGAPDGILAHVRAALGLPRADSAGAILARELARLDAVGLARLANLFEAHGGKKTVDAPVIIRDWLASDPPRRAAKFEQFARVLLTDEGTPRAHKGWIVADMCAADPSCTDLVNRLQADVLAANDLRLMLECADVAATHLRVAAALAAERETLKSDLGALAFDDLIARAAQLLRTPGASDWVRFKLDNRIDHILVDEAQDTNGQQWQIVDALAEEFFAGQGAHHLPRTLFAVGDYKQAIFGFQGTDPAEFEAARRRLRDAGVHVADVPLADNFRSVPAILTVVDQVIADAGAEALGLSADVPAHRAARNNLPGSVTLWQRIPASGGADEEEADAGERGWISTADRTMAAKIAGQVREWLDAPLMLPARGRAVRPEDILILVRRRGAFVPALVAALGQAGVPVAGADRLQLRAPIAAKDVVSLIRFVLQPDDDLSLAELLVSPLIGLSQDELMAVAAPRPGKTPLWSAVRDSAAPEIAAACAWLMDALAIADYAPPRRFIEDILNLGRFAGRARMLARLGTDARDVLDELVHAAYRFEADHPPSLQGFLHWLEASDIDVKRGPAGPRGEVRVMTVHGAKGLQAPIVILADASGNPHQDRSGHVPFMIGDALLPVFHNGTKKLRGDLRKAQEARDARAAQEQLRLLYVALTRAEDMLFIGGVLPSKPSKTESSWWDRAEAALMALGAPARPDDRWGELRHFAPPAAAAPLEAPPPPAAEPPPLPHWATIPAEPEARPPRPLAPSRLELDGSPMRPAALSAARRGRLLHLLFERAPFDHAAALGWLAREAPELGEGAREELVAAAEAVILHPAHAALFSAAALAEVPLAAVVGGTVVAGKVDRLLVEEGRVLVVDFKTGTRIPAPAHIPPGHLAQMALYAAALARIFPGRRIEAALLYVAGPVLYPLDEAALRAHLPDGVEAAPPAIK